LVSFRLGNSLTISLYVLNIKDLSALVYIYWWVFLTASSSSNNLVDEWFLSQENFRAFVCAERRDGLMCVAASLLLTPTFLACCVFLELLLLLLYEHTEMNEMEKQ